MTWLLFFTVERKYWCQTDMFGIPLMPIGCVTSQNWCQTRGCCRNPELNLRCRGMVCNSLVMQKSTRICNVFFADFCKCLAIANYQALGLTHGRAREAQKDTVQYCPRRRMKIGLFDDCTKLCYDTLWFFTFLASSSLVPATPNILTTFSL